MSWVSVNDGLPSDREYVLVHLTKDNWIPASDPLGVYFKVAKIEYGISDAQRNLMKSGDLPDPVQQGVKRSDTYRSSDEWANNLKPYCWEEFGPGSYFGQEVDFWMRIPNLPGMKRASERVEVPV